MNVLITTREAVPMSFKAIVRCDFVFFRNEDGTYDVLKNRFDGTRRSAITWADCEALMDQSREANSQAEAGAI